MPKNVFTIIVDEHKSKISFKILLTSLIVTFNYYCYLVTTSNQSLIEL
jgi:hypothetical protein